MKKNGMIWFETVEDLIKNKELILKFLFNSKLSNYGYDLKTFKKMTNYKYNLLRKLKEGKFYTGEFFGIYGRLYLYITEDGEKVVRYCSGQSFNEELITILECLTQSRRRNDEIDKEILKNDEIKKDKANELII